MRLDVGQDIYCVGFITFIKPRSRTSLNQIVLKCAASFMLQCTSVYLLLYYYFWIRENERKHHNPLFDIIFEGKTALNMMRLVCSFLLHVNLLHQM